MRKYLLISMTLLLTVTVVLGLSSVVKKGSVLEVERYQNTAKSDPALLKKIAQLDKNIKKLNADGRIKSVLRGSSLSIRVSDSVLFFDDFEGSVANWIPDASWNNVAQDQDEDGFGQAMAPTSTWETSTASSNSPDTSWHQADGVDQTTDMLVSPVIQLPDSVHAFGVTSPMKGGIISLYADAQGLSSSEVFLLYIGLAEATWGFSTADSAPGGTSAWLCSSTDSECTLQAVALYT